MRYEFFRAFSALRFKSALSAYEPTMGLSINGSRDLQPEVLNKGVRKQALSSTVLITVWRLELSHVIAVMSLLSSYPNPEHVTFIFRIS